jgi:DNA invertase Pin-like site-specific DNA recombinase
MFELVSELFSVQLSERITDVQTTKAKQALYNGGPIPLGFKIDTNKKYQVDEYLVPIVRNIFNEAANGKPLKEIIDELASLNIT